SRCCDRSNLKNAPYRNHARNPIKARIEMIFNQGQGTKRKSSRQTTLPSIRKIRNQPRAKPRNALRLAVKVKVSTRSRIDGSFATAIVRFFTKYRLLAGRLRRYQ